MSPADHQTVTPSAEPVLPPELDALIRQYAQLGPMPAYLKQPVEEFARRCREEAERRLRAGEPIPDAVPPVPSSVPEPPAFGASATLNGYGLLETLYGARPVSTGTESAWEALAAALAHHIRQILARHEPVEPFTVAGVVDAAVAKVWGTAVLPFPLKCVVYAVAAEVMRRALRTEAESARTAGLTSALTEPVNEHSYGPYAGGAHGAIARDEWWQETATRDPELARVYALHRFAGRSVHEVAELLGTDRPTVRARLFLADQQIDVATARA